MALLGGLAIGALNLTGSLANIGLRESQARRASLLAESLLAEIMSVAYEEPDGSTTLGLDSGETNAGGSRLSFDDVDDYHGLYENPPQNTNGGTVAGFGGWEASVSVDWVRRNDLSVSASDTGLKLITVTVLDPMDRLTVVYALRSRHGIGDQTHFASRNAVMQTTIRINPQSSTQASVGGAAHPNLPEAKP